MSFTIERAHIRDLKLVKPFWKTMVAQYAQVSGGCWPVRDPAEAWQRRHQEYMDWINDGVGVVFVARDESTQEALGYAALHFAPSSSAFDTGERYGELESLIVDEARRGEGIGRALIQACRKELRKRDIEYWSLDTLAANTRALSLYEKVGFIPFITRMVQRVDADVTGAQDAGLTASMPILTADTSGASGAAGAPTSSGLAAPWGASAVSTTTTTASEASDASEGSVVSVTQTALPGEVDPSVRAEVEAVARSAGDAARSLALLSRAEKDAALRALADALEANQQRILAANEMDLRRGQERGLPAGLLDRIRLDAGRLAGIADALRHLVTLPDPIGEVVRGSTLANGLQLRQVRVPLGVVGIIYEARPNVTVDAAGLALKSGNAVVLRGGSAAQESNVVLVEVLRDALAARGLPRESVSLLTGNRDSGRALMQAHGLVDVIIPRGGADLIATVVRESSVPVIETGSGNVHVYVDAAADLRKALPIVLNSKTQRPSVCNAAETLLVHRAVADEFLPVVLPQLAERGVVLHGDEATRSAAGAGGLAVDAADETAYATEFHALEMAVRVVDSLDEALEHVRRYSTGHTEAIVTEDRRAARRWVSEIDAAVVVVNASTRFTDGGEFGFGAEIGISTQKLHARGPMALAELTSTKWIVEGDGQVRG